MTSYIIRSSILGIIALIALIFIPAGTVHYWEGWTYVAVWIISGGAYTAYLGRHDPALLKRRSEAGIFVRERACTEGDNPLSFYRVCRTYYLTAS